MIFINMPRLIAKQLRPVFSIPALVLLSFPALIAQAPFPVVSTLHPATIAGRPIAKDTQGKLLPWPMPDNVGYSYSSHFLTQWTILWDQFNRQRYPYFFCCFDFDRTTFEMQPDYHWANSTAYLRAMMEGFIERLYPYTGNINTITFLQDFIDYELENGLTPENYAWSRVPYTSANPGDRRYSGWSRHGEDFLEPHVVGEDGYAYLRFYEITGNTKYLDAALRCAAALVKNYKPGSAEVSPWPVRCHARDGSVEGQGMGPYSANVVEPIMLFDELIRLGKGDTADYKSVREGCWRWLHTYPLKNNAWVGYFEDVQPTMENMNQVIPLEYARYVLLHPEKDPEWKENAGKLIEWVKTTPKWPKYVVDGATVTTEQGNGKTFCCNLPNQCCDSHTARLASVEALYYARTGDATYKEQAFRSFNWVTYFQGMPAGAHAPFGGQWWFTDEFADGPRRVMDAFWAIPEWAPNDQSHLLGSSSAVTKIAYGSGSVTYSTFDPDSSDVLRLNFDVDSVSSGGRRLRDINDLSGEREGFSFDRSTRVLRIHHLQSRDVSIQGQSQQPVPLLVDFDNPHRATNSLLEGEYPSGVIKWPEAVWKVCAPAGRFSTFSVAIADTKITEAEFRFPSPRILLGFDVYNSSDREITVSVKSNETQPLEIRLRPDELQHINTGWLERSTLVTVNSEHLADIRFDNLAYSSYLWGSIYRGE